MQKAQRAGKCMLGMSMPLCADKAVWMCTCTPWAPLLNVGSMAPGFCCLGTLLNQLVQVHCM
jgi:hypothetical protein